MTKNDNPSYPWNDGQYKDDPRSPHNDPMYRDDPSKPWNQASGSINDLNDRERDLYGQNK